MGAERLGEQKQIDVCFSGCCSIVLAIKSSVIGLSVHGFVAGSMFWENSSGGIPTFRKLYHPLNEVHNQICMNRTFLLQLLVFVGAAVHVNGQSRNVGRIIFNDTVTRQLIAGQVDRYEMNLAAGQFAAVQVIQKSIGISYAVYGPGDSLLLNEDLNAIGQNEVITIAAYRKGSYYVDIAWDYGRPQQGEYQIVWSCVDKIAKSPSGRALQLMTSWYRPSEPGGAVLVIKGGKEVFKTAIGLANMEHRQPLSADSPFELASCAKQFTGLAIALLLDRGNIRLDDSIQQYLPELPSFGQKITIENLIYHTSGIRNWDCMSNALGMRADDVLTTDIIYKMICQSHTLNFIPGAQCSYSNSGYVLLALIVERVSGKKFSDWMQAEIFRPLEMKNSGIRDDIHLLIPGRVDCYRKAAGGYRAVPANISAIGSTSVYASINDLAKWMANMHWGMVGGRNVLELLQRPAMLNDGKKVDFYAFGNGFGDFKGTRKIEHLGLVAGYRTVIARYPDQDLSVIFLSNDDNDATFGRAWAIAQLFLEQLQQAPVPAVNYPDLAAALIKTGEKAPVPPPGDKVEYEGIYYADDLNSHYQIRQYEGVLTATSYRFDRIQLSWEKGERFSGYFPAFSRLFVFLRDKDKKIMGFKLTGGDKEVLFRKCDALLPVTK